MAAQPTPATKAPAGWPKLTTPLITLAFAEAQHLPREDYEKVRDILWNAMCGIAEPDETRAVDLGVLVWADNDLFDAGLPELEDLITGALNRYFPDWHETEFVTPRSKFVLAPKK